MIEKDVMKQIDKLIEDLERCTNAISHMRWRISYNENEIQRLTYENKRLKGEDNE